MKLAIVDRWGGKEELEVDDFGLQGDHLVLFRMREYKDDPIERPAQKLIIGAVYAPDLWVIDYE